MVHPQHPAKKGAPPSACCTSHKGGQHCRLFPNLPSYGIGRSGRELRITRSRALGSLVGLRITKLNFDPFSN